MALEQGVLPIEGEERVVKVFSPLIFSLGDVEIPERESEAAEAVGGGVAEICLVGVAKPYSVVGDRGGEGTVSIGYWVSLEPSIRGKNKSDSILDLFLLL